MSTSIHVIPEPLPTTTETRVAAYLLAEYLERLGVQVIFGLTGHTVIAMLDALGRSSIRYVSTRHEQVAAHAADGYARASGKPGVLLTHLGPGLTNAATGVANAALDSIPMVVIAGDVQSYFHGRHPHQEINLHQDADQFRDLPPVLQARLSSGQRPRPAAGHRARVPPGSGWPARTCAGGCADGCLLCQPARGCLRQDAGGNRAADNRRGHGGAHCRDTCPRRTAGLVCGRRRAVGTRGRRAHGAGGGARGPCCPFLDGEGCRTRRSSAPARHDGLLGHADREREMPDRRCHPGDRHTARGGQLELVGSTLHVRHSADALDPYRRRRRRDRPQLPHRAGCRRGRQAGTRHRSRRSRRARRTARVARCERKSPPAAVHLPPIGRITTPPANTRCGPSGF